LITKRFFLFALLALVALALSACSASATNSNWPGLAADSNAAYLANGTQVIAVRLSDRADLWKYPQKADSKKVFYANPVILPDGRLLIGSAGSDHCLYVLDPTKISADTKEPAATCIFSSDQDRWIASPLVVDNTVYAPNNDGNLYAVNLTSGELLWSLKIGSGGHLWSAPITDGKTLFLSSLDHNVYAIDIATHTIAWAADLKGSVSGSPALSADGKTLYVGSFNSKAFALNTATGKIIWQADTKNWVWGTPAVQGSTVYFADLDGQIYAFDAQTGKQVWDVQPDGPITANPLLMEDRIVVVSESGSVSALGQDGKSAWANTYSTTGKIYTTPVAAGDLVLVAPYGDKITLIALDKDGKQVWTYPPATQ